MALSVESLNDYLNSHPKLPGGITHEWVRMRWAAYERKIWYSQVFGQYNYPLVFWFNMRTAFYFQSKRIFRSHPATLDEFMRLLDEDCDRIRSDFAESYGTGGRYDRELRAICVLRNDPLVFDENSRIFHNITLVGEALDAINEKISAVEKLTRQQLIDNARVQNDLANIERTVKLRGAVDSAVKRSGGAFDKDAAN